MEGIQAFEIESTKIAQPQIPEEIEININEEDDLIKPSKAIHYTFFLFVNPTSGGNRAASLTKLDVEKFAFSTFRPNDSKVGLHIYNLLDAESRERGFLTLKRKQDAGKKNIRVIVGGGDGTVLWVIEELIKVQADLDKCPIGVIPFGTGNDFSRVLGWGGAEPSVLIGSHLGGLKSLVEKWATALIEDFDIWDVEIETYEYGGVKKIYREDGKKYSKQFISEMDLETKTMTKVTKLKKRMCNYLSFGLDSRIGYGFDKRRTQSRCGNKAVYCLEGIKKLFLKTPTVNDVLEVVHYDRASDPERSIVHNPNTQQVDEITGANFHLYPSSNEGRQFNGNEADTKITLIKKNPAIFLCLNIPSYMGGASDPWGTSKGKVGVVNHEKGIIPDFDDQRFGDDKLEILGFTGPWSLAMERFSHGQGWRLGQVKGPFVITFRQSENHQKPIHTYMQIDGEFYDVVAPKTVRVSLTKDIARGKVKVMVNAESRK